MARLYAMYTINNIPSSRERVYRNRSDAFSLPEDSFVTSFRLSKDLGRYLCSQVRTDLARVTANRTVMSVETQVLCALRFYATGSYQGCIGQDLHVTLSQSSVSRAVRRVTESINKRMLFQEVSFPAQHEYAETKRKFMESSGFPGVIGAIDCTHIPIIAPEEPLEHCYINRKGYHSINVQLVCDTDLKILNVNAKHAGRTHDAFIWRYSALREILSSENSDEQNGWLIGDSGYPLEEWLLTSISHPQSDGECRYNAAHAKARNCIERCNGVLKARFRCLHKHRVLHYKPTVASQIINACVVLHNLCIRHKLDVCGEAADGDDDDDDDDYADDQNQQNAATNTQNGMSVRRTLIRNHFE